MPERDEMMKRQQVLADFGEFAIRSDDLDDVLAEACRLVAEALDTGRAKILEIQESRRELFVRAGVGWAPDVVGTVRLPMDERSSETFSVGAGEPVITQDIAREDRFEVPAFMKEAGVVALVNVPIFVPGQRPYGILQVDSITPRQFEEEDIQFLRTYASILGPVIDRLHLVEERRANEDRQRLLLELSDAIRSLGDPREILLTAVRILGRHLKASRVAYAEDLGDGEHYEMADNYVDGVAQIVGRYRYADYGSDIRDQLRAGVIRVQHDIRNDERLTAAERQRLADADVGASLNIPLIKHGRLVAWLGITYKEAHHFRPDEIEIAKDVCDRTWTAVEGARAEDARRESEARISKLFELMPAAVYTCDTEGRITFYNKRAAELWGCEPKLHDERFRFCGAFRLWNPDGSLVAHDACPMGDAIREGRSVRNLEIVVEQPGGQRLVANVNIDPLFDANGALVGAINVFADVTQSKRAAEALRRSEEDLRAILESALDYAIFTTDPEGNILTWSPGAEAVFGWTAREAIGEDSAMTFTPEDREHGVPREELAQARDKGFAPNVRWHVRNDGRRVFIEGSTRPLGSEGTSPRGFLKIGQDVTDRKQWEERQQVLVAELQHRTRNLIAVVRSMADKTMRRANDLQGFRQGFGDRLEALARVQGLLSRLEEHDRVAFDVLIRTELMSLGVEGNDERVSLAGPEGVRLRSSTVQTLAMALHELATNASKYGALSQGSGHLAISWRLEPADAGEEPWLHIDWRESGVSMPGAGSEPTGTGQGRELIERALPYQLQAKTSYELGPDGVHCSISIPVSAWTRLGEAGPGRGIAARTQHPGG